MDTSDSNNNSISVQRPSWNEFFKEIVMISAKRSPCKRLKVGCLLVKDKRIISQGYNGYLPNCPHEQKLRDGHELATIHAEQNAVTDCAKRGVSCEGATAYITHYPCIHCMKVLCASGIREIYYINDYKNDELVKYFSDISDVGVHKLE
jgi:dCMP deaminase